MSAMQHIVLIKFAHPLKDEEIQWIDQRLSRWHEGIAGIVSIRWGQDVSGRSRGYQWGLVIEFSSQEAEDRYHPHPLHQEFAQWVAGKEAEVLAFDFPIARGAAGV
ncbi:MAG: hypothetical protein C7B46_05770 [Sulfobacillus benefaciens]|uniref:Stress-response A/B barrel domain-containing protein n=1 Tax=Sulfobacillus benefaciens TaxID=453960 RepID=A0A2T2XIU4_9FIRM|nr:MAG: hypothetical protein C7B46_05770 [Sulfobacillus benefaciens]